MQSYLASKLIWVSKPWACRMGPRWWVAGTNHAASNPFTKYVSCL